MPIKITNSPKRKEKERKKIRRNINGRGYEILTLSTLF